LRLGKELSQKVGKLVGGFLGDVMAAVDRLAAYVVGPVVPRGAELEHNRGQVGEQDQGAAGGPTPHPISSA
jgi:hypothetical protein